MTRNIPSRLKLSNRKIVYRLLASVGSISRAEISRVTGISGATVLKIIDFFIDNKIAVYEGIDETFTTVGRKPTNLRFNPDFAYTLAVIIEGNYVNAGIVNMDGNIIYRTIKKQINDFRTFLEIDLINLIKDTASKSGVDDRDIIGIGLGLPGIINTNKNIIYSAPLLGIEKDYNISVIIKNLETQIQKPIFVENDVNASAYGEYKIKFKDSENDIVFISVGTGVGAGIILNGKVRRGSNYFSGEIGYMCFDKKYSHAKDKSGWFESKINLASLKEKFDFSINERDSINYKQVLKELTEYLALAVVNIDAILNVDTIVVGGVIAEYFKEDLISSIINRCSSLAVYTPKIKLPECEEVGIIGMGALVSENILTSLLGEE